jgi:RNA polymerase sigma factor (sigma-70 family)
MMNHPDNFKIYDHKASLTTFAINFTRNEEDANDLVQDTMYRAMTYRNLYREGTNLQGWLYTIMRNVFINNYRKSTRRSSLIDTCDDLNSLQLSGSASFNKAEDKFLNDDLNKALKNLPSTFYVPFIKYFEGFKYHEIAEELGIPIGTVKTRIHYARQVLKKDLKMYN